ncbi:hypothetical protein BDY19DRAFT_912788 [Irpex rosettiformis]|uniref:Uncharacterized protein n=1 Tax=Irpex rosettiformis TaxID=378272 RepID=A0ACB8UJD2_9APHY|nr:hypothetical protein BDY19DRAFT_912788 [Irpex rosettiformis]
MHMFRLSCIIMFISSMFHMQQWDPFISHPSTALTSAKKTHAAGHVHCCPPYARASIVPSQCQSLSLPPPHLSYKSSPSHSLKDDRLLLPPSPCTSES